MNRFSFFTSAEAKTTSPTYKGAGKLIFWERNTQPGPGILVPRKAEVSPLIKTSWTIVFLNLVCFANLRLSAKGWHPLLILRRWPRPSVWRPSWVQPGLQLWGACALRAACSALFGSGRFSCEAYPTKGDGWTLLGTSSALSNLIDRSFWAASVSKHYAGTKKYFWEWGIFSQIEDYSIQY